MSYENYVINGPPRKPTRIKVRHKGSLGGPGYTTKPATERRRLLWRHLEKHGYASTISALQSRINLGSRTMGKRAHAAFESDKAWLQKEHEQMAKLTGAAKAAFKAKMAAGRKAAARNPTRNGPKAKRARRARAAAAAAAEAEAEAEAARDIASALGPPKKRKKKKTTKKKATKKKTTKKKTTKKKATKKKATKKKAGKTAAQRKASAAKGAKTRKANEAKKKRAAAKSAKTRKDNAAAAKRKSAAAKRKKAAPKKKKGRKKKRKQSSKKTECYARRVYLKTPTRGESAAGATLRKSRSRPTKAQAAGVLATKMHKDYDCRQVERNYFDFSVPNSKLGGA